MLSFNSGFCSLGVCVYIHFYGCVYSRSLWQNGLWWLSHSKGSTCICTCVSMCVGVCVSEWEEFTYSNPGNTHGYVWFWMRGAAVSEPRIRPAQAKRLDVNVWVPLRDARPAWKHLEGIVLFQALKAGESCWNYLAVSSPPLAAADTITSMKRRMESEKDLRMGCCNHGYPSRVTYDL